MEFERAAVLRDRITQLQDFIGKKMSEVKLEAYEARGKRRGGKKERVPRPKKSV